MCEPTEDSCEACTAPHAPLALHLVLIARGPVIDTIIYPVCERCYQEAMDAPSPSAFRVIKDPIPEDMKHMVKVWTKRDYQLSWPEEDRCRSLLN